MPILVRTRNHGRSFELRITHRLLSRPVYRTCNSDVEAQAVGAKALAVLDRGTVPDWLKPQEERSMRTIGDAIRENLSIRAVRPSTRLLLRTLDSEVGAAVLADVDHGWAERWIKTLKLEHQLTPGTIRKKKIALSGVLTWVTLSRPLCLATNPLAALPRGYSGYDEHSEAALARAGLDVPEDASRTRRIDRTEQARIVGELQRLKAAASTTADQARYEGMALMFELALCTAMRLREIFTLTLDQIDVEWRTVFLKKTKNGWNRNVPLNSSAVELLSRSWPALEAARTSPQLLPFWNGNRKDHTLRQVSAELSAAFRKVFDSVGSFDLHFHDTRHEAVCRWVLEALVPLKDTFLSSAAGMTDAKTRDRYLSLRGHELAKMLA